MNSTSDSRVFHAYSLKGIALESRWGYQKTAKIDLNEFKLHIVTLKCFCPFLSFCVYEMLIYEAAKVSRCNLSFSFKILHFCNFFPFIEIYKCLYGCRDKEIMIHKKHTNLCICLYPFSLKIWLKKWKLKEQHALQSYVCYKFILICLHFWQVSMVNHFGVVIERILWAFVFDYSYTSFFFPFNIVFELLII